MVEKENIRELDKEVHKLKGALSLVTLHHLYEAVVELNERTKGKNRKLIQPLYACVAQQAAVFMKTIQLASL